MPRRPRPLRADEGPTARFALALRELRDRAGAKAPSIDQISVRAGIPRSTLYAALRGQRVPTRDVLASLVQAWGGDEGEWMIRRSAAEAELEAVRLLTPTQRPAHQDTYVSLRSNRVSTSVPSMEDNTLAEFALRLSELRAARGLPSYRDLSRQSGIPYSTVAASFSGKVLPKWEAIGKIVKILQGDIHVWRFRWEELASLHHRRT
ncbi:helix-turn-helix transcriptional regulator [Nonomuraea sp. NPDC050540]|uniref:helix-turn-helix transcriptional regulator n=1 Tax=Nonomuraea sp. NPDC050540 TaxID=3364367 RepID=UPI0037891A05